MADIKIENNKMFYSPSYSPYDRWELEINNIAVVGVCDRFAPYDEETIYMLFIDKYCNIYPLDLSYAAPSNYSDLNKVLDAFNIETNKIYDLLNSQNKKNDNLILFPDELRGMPFYALPNFFQKILFFFQSNFKHPALIGLMNPEIIKYINKSSLK